MTTNTPINWFATYGAIYGLLFCIAIFRLAKILDNRLILIILISLVILLSISTENYLRNVSVIVFLLYGLSESIHQEGKVTLRHLVA